MIGEGRKRRGRFPLQLGTLDPVVEEGSEGSEGSEGLGRPGTFFSTLSTVNAKVSSHKFDYILVSK